MLNNLRHLLLLGIFLCASIALRAEEATNSTNGLQPLRPPKGATVSRHLRSEPSENAPLLRQLQPTDKLQLLRNQGEWYEVEVKTQEGLEFLGWTKSKRPTERTPPPPPPIPSQAGTTSLKPIESENFDWFWSQNLRETWRFSLGIGYQNIQYLQSGIYASTGLRGEVYDFNLNGIAIKLDTELNILETPLFSKPFFWTLGTKYIFSLYQIKLSNTFPIAGLQGSAYSITTNTIDLASTAKMSLFEQGDKSLFKLGLGAGYIFYEFGPDLAAVDGGTFDGKFVFTDFNFYGITVPLILESNVQDWLHLQLRFLPIFLAQLDEKPSNTSGDNLKASGFPWTSSFSATYFWNPNWGVNLDINYLFIDGKNTGVANRIATEAFSEARLQFRSLTMGVGLSGQF